MSEIVAMQILPHEIIEMTCTMSIILLRFFVLIPMCFSTMISIHQSSHLARLLALGGRWQKTKLANRLHGMQFSSDLFCFYFDVTVIHRMFQRALPIQLDCMFSSTLRDMNLCIMVSESIYSISAYFVL